MYSVIFATDVAEDLTTIDSPMARRKVLAAIQCMPLDPEGMGIADVVDTAGHIHRIGLAGGVAFVFHADHALRQIRILAIQSVLEE
ncbi:MAG TPA: hypothetical protein VGA56_03210 [Opitutaceae bacterium]